MTDNSTADLTSQIPTTSKGEPLTAKYIRDQYTRGTAALRKQQYEYVRNMAFLDGQQWLQYNTALNRWSQIPKDPERVQVTFNVLRPNMRTIMSKAMSRELVFEVLPADNDSASVRGAQTSEGVVNDIHCEHDWENLRAEAFAGAFIGGTAILSIDWNPKAGPTIDHLPITGEPIGIGDTEESILSIAEVAWEPGIKRAESGYWWVRAQALPPAMVKQTYGLNEEPAADVQGAVSPIATLLNQHAQGNAHIAQTLVLTYYERPNPLRPNGAIATVIGDKIIGDVKDWYFPFDDHLNMVVMRETKVPGQAAGETVFSDACRVQKSFNDAWSNLLEHHKMTGSARVLVPEGSLDDIEGLSDLPGEFILYNSATGKPEYLSPPVLPNWIMQSIADLRSEIDNIMSVHDISRGQAPTNADSGVAYSILAEQDNTPIGLLTREVAYAFERLAEMLLQLYAKNVRETRRAKINRDSNPESVEWTGASLQNQFDVNIPIDAIMPRSHAADFAMAQALFQNKIINDPRDFIRIAQQPGYKELLPILDPDSAKAERENNLMCLGHISIPSLFDDHRKHIEIHNRFRKTTRYDSLDKVTQSVFDDHVKAHEVLAAEQAGLQQQKLGVSPGLANVPTAGAEEPILGQPFAQAQLGINQTPPPAAPVPPQPLPQQGGG